MPNECPCDPCDCGPACTCGCGPDCKCGEGCACQTKAEAISAV